MNALPSPVYRQVLGADFERLCPAVRNLHDVTRSYSATGHCDIQRGDHWFARLLATLARLPPAGRNVAIAFSITVENGRERWVRDFAGNQFRSVMWIARGHLCERVGPVSLAYRLEIDNGCLHMVVIGGQLLGILPLPRFLLPRVSTSESCQDGIYHFDVAANWPIIGRVIRYTGTLKP